MLDQEYQRMYEVEDRYWWFVSRRRLVLDLMAAGTPTTLDTVDRPVILDVGCGTGANAEAMTRLGRVIGADMSPLALARCQRRSLNELVQAKAESVPLRSESVDWIVATDILEHLDDDRAALKEFQRLLRPGGRALITVPAYRSLWSEHDEALMHRRRYVKQELRAAIEDSGLDVERITYAFCLLLPLALTRLLKREKPRDRPPEAQMTPVPEFVNRMLIWVQGCEARVLRNLNLPWGLSVVGIARKRERGEG